MNIRKAWKWNSFLITMRLSTCLRPAPSFFSLLIRNEPHSDHYDIEQADSKAVLLFKHNSYEAYLSADKPVQCETSNIVT